MRPVFVVLVAVLAVSVGVAACSSSKSSSTGSTAGPEARGYKPTPVRMVGTLSLTDYATDPAGAPLPLRASPGDLLVVYFGYLTCPDICPVTMADLAAGLDEVGHDVAGHVEVAFETIDLERDSGARITEYLTHFFPDTKIHALRATDEHELSGVTYMFGAQWQIDPHEPGQTYGVAHSGLTYVVDDAGHLVWEWPFGTTGPEVAVTLRQLMTSVYPNA